MPTTRNCWVFSSLYIRAVDGYVESAVFYMLLMVCQSVKHAVDLGQTVENMVKWGGYTAFVYLWKYTSLVRSKRGIIFAPLCVAI